MLLSLIPAFGTGRAQAATKTWEFKVNNITAKNLTVTLLGPENYVIPAPPGKTRTDVQDGKYQYSYYDCGGLQVGQINIHKKDVELKIVPCGAPASAGVATTGGATLNAPNSVMITINNRTPRHLNVSLVGQLIYRLAAPPGKSVHEVTEGKYTLSYYDCGGLLYDSINMKKDTFLYRIKDCYLPGNSGSGATGASALPTGVGSGAISADGLLLVNNKSGGELYLYLRGTSFHTLKVPVGKSKFDVNRGYYVLSYYACGQLQDGAVNVRNSGSEVVLSDCSGKFKGQAVTGEVVRFRINNNTDEKFEITLTGPQDYTFTVILKRGSFDVQKGIYSYTYTVCGFTFYGVANIQEGTLIKSYNCGSND
jgi:hypothetical protein